MNLFQLIHKPVYQGLLFILFTIMATFIAKPRTADTIWVISGLAYGLFILTNTILVFYAINVWSYFFISLGCSLLYLLVIALTTKILMNALKAEGSEESAMIFIVIIFHPISLLLGIFLKWVLLKMF